MGGPTAKLPGCSRRPSAVLAALVLLAGCGGSHHAQTTATQTHPKPAQQSQQGTETTPAPTDLHRANPKNVAIVRGWVDALRAGHIAKAAGYFAVPALVQNATPPFFLRSREAVRLFNQSLPCGARVVRAVASTRYTIVTFKLFERRGRGAGCGSGVGGVAATAFRFRHGRISEWRRVLVPRSRSRSPRAPREQA